MVVVTVVEHRTVTALLHQAATELLQAAVVATITPVVAEAAVAAADGVEASATGSQCHPHMIIQK